MIGKVKWYNKEKGYGFIVSDEVGEDVFVNYTAISDGRDRLNAKEEVEFECHTVDGKKQASNVSKYDRPKIDTVEDLADFFSGKK